MLLSATPREERRGWGVNFSSFATCYANILHAEKEKERGAASHFLLLFLPFSLRAAKGRHTHMDMEIGAAAVLKMANDGRSRQAQKSWAEQGKGKSGKWDSLNIPPPPARLSECRHGRGSISSKKVVSCVVTRRAFIRNFD